MAAKLKKRALAEYQQSQVQQGEEPQERNKRQKLVLRSDSSVEKDGEEVLGLDTEASGRDAIRNIIGFTTSLDTLSTEVVIATLKKIIELISKESDPCVKAKLVAAWGEVLALENAEDVSGRVDEMLPVKEDSKKVTGAWLAALIKIVKCQNLNKSLKQKIFLGVISLLHSTSHPIVHCKCLELLSRLASPDTAGQCEQAVQLCGSYSLAQDARVRTAAFHSLLTLHRRGVRLDVKMYPVLCTALADDYEGVRCEALKLLSALAMTEPEHQVDLVGDTVETNRLVDDVFSRTCQAINDVREQVRALAARLIGDMKGVSKVFLEQTLDKKLMSNMRLKKSAHERMANLISSGDWSSGKKWADDAPKEHLNEAQINLVSFGSCGAFVHGLEDECLSVRVASVESLTKLAITNKDLALIALDFLVDMFNDEIEGVRLGAIESLTSIARHIQLHSHQLEIILATLDDFSTLMREKLHVMLQACTIATKDGLKMVIQKLLNNLKRYPQDRRSIFVTFKQLGGNHPDLTLPLVTSLLDIHPYFDTKESDIEDPAYLCTLILVLNAAQHCPTLPQLLDSHTVRHQSYLRDTFPQLIPAQASSAVHHTSLSVAQLSAESTEFLDSVLARVARATTSNSPRALAVLTSSVAELERLADIEPALADSSSFGRIYMEGQALFLRVLADPSWAQTTLQHGPVIKNNIAALQAIVTKLHSMFSDIGPENKLLIRMMKLKVTAVNLVYTVCGSNKSALSLADLFMSEFESLKKDEEQCREEAFICGVTASLAGGEAKPGYIARKLRPLLVQYPPAGLAGLPHQLSMARAVVHEPAGGQETPLKCMAGLVLGIPLDCEVHNIADPALLRICIFTGDQQHHLSTPRRGDLVPLPAGSGFRLITTALLSHQVRDTLCPALN